MPPETTQELRIVVKVEPETGKIEVLNATLEKTEKQLKKGTEASKGFSLDWKDLLTAVGLGAFTFASVNTILSQFVSLLRQGVKDAVENIIAMKRLEFQVKAAGIAWDECRATLTEYFNTLAAVTRFEQTELVRTFTMLLKYTGDITSAQRLLNLSMNLAVATQRELSDIAQTLAYALTFPQRGVRMLVKEFGVLVGNTKDIVKAIENLEKATEGYMLRIGDSIEQIRYYRARWREFWEEMGNFVMKFVDAVVVGFGWLIDNIPKSIRMLYEQIMVVTKLNHAKIITDFRGFLKDWEVAAEETRQRLMKEWAKEEEERRKQIKETFEVAKKGEIKIREVAEEEADKREEIEKRVNEIIREMKKETYEGAKELLDEEFKVLVEFINKKIDEYQRDTEEYKRWTEAKVLINEWYSERIKEITEKATEEELSGWEEMGEVFKDMEEKKVNVVDEATHEIITRFKGCVDSIVDTFRDGMVELITTGNIAEEGLAEIWERMKKAFINAITAMVAEYIAKMTIILTISAITGIPVGAIGGALGMGGIVGLLSLQKGGIVRKPTIALLGEKGPEAVVPLEKTNRIGTNLTFDISIHTMDLRAGMDVVRERLVRDILPIIKRELKR